VSNFTRLPRACRVGHDGGRRDDERSRHARDRREARARPAHVRTSPAANRPAPPCTVAPQDPVRWPPRLGHSAILSMNRCVFIFLEQQPGAGGGWLPRPRGSDRSRRAGAKRAPAAARRAAPVGGRSAGIGAARRALRRLRADDRDSNALRPRRRVAACRRRRARSLPHGRRPDRGGGALPTAPLPTPRWGCSSCLPNLYWDH